MTENFERIVGLLPDALAWSIEFLIVTVEVGEGVDVVVDIARPYLTFVNGLEVPERDEPLGCLDGGCRTERNILVIRSNPVKHERVPHVFATLARFACHSIVAAHIMALFVGLRNESHI